ncbi:MAG: TRAP transporter small permease [Desulfobacterales bacterium]|jgi:TRAP-type C4-dicarboxylate transport system permease small subunit|nr:TRAP transporter small permease [Desulfobacterales bacterium]MCK5204275.1 TRAP transporter small permease [Desulfobacterales bacterium]
MSGFGRGVQRLSYGLNLLAGCLLVGMTALTCADVILRIFRRPILGSYEIVEFIGATAAGFALAYTTLKRGHVAVSILVALFPKRVQTIIYLIVQLVSISLFALLSWECISYGNDLKSAGEVSLTLELPFFPVLYGLAFSAFVVCLVLGLDFWRVLTGKEKPWYLWNE